MALTGITQTTLALASLPVDRHRPLRAGGNGRVKTRLRDQLGMFREVHHGTAVPRVARTDE